VALNYTTDELRLSLPRVGGGRMLVSTRPGREGETLEQMVRLHENEGCLLELD